MRSLLGRFRELLEREVVIIDSSSSSFCYESSKQHEWQNFQCMTLN